MLAAFLVIRSKLQQEEPELETLDNIPNSYRGEFIIAEGIVSGLDTSVDSINKLMGLVSLNIWEGDSTNYLFIYSGGIRQPFLEEIFNKNDFKNNRDEEWALFYILKLKKPMTYEGVNEEGLMRITIPEFELRVKNIPILE